MIVIQDNSSVKGKLLSFNSRPRGQEHKNPEDKLHNYQNERMTLHFQKEKKGKEKQKLWEEHCRTVILNLWVVNPHPLWVK